jgi:hypothetical protein
MANNNTKLATIPTPDDFPRRNVIEPATLDEIMTYAAIALKSQYFGVRSVEEAAVKILLGKELGLSTFQAMMGVSVIQGRPSLSAGLVSSLIKQSNRYDYRVNEWSATACKISFYQGNQLLGNSIYTIEDAKRAQLVKPSSNWEKYPKSMVFARAITQGARAYTPDIFMGPVYTPDEIIEGEIIDVNVEPLTETLSEPAPEPAKNGKPKVQTTPAKPAPEPIPEAVETPWEEPDLSKPAESQQPIEMQSQAQSFGEIVTKIDTWASKAADEYARRGLAQYGHPGAVINTIYETMANETIVSGKATTYRQKVNEIAKSNDNWETTLSMLKYAAGRIASEHQAGN